MNHYYPDVPGLGNVAISRHAQERALEDGISQHDFDTALIRGETIPDGQDVVWRQANGVRIVIVKRPTPFRGAMLATTAYRIEEQARAR